MLVVLSINKCICSSFIMGNGLVLVRVALANAGNTRCDAETHPEWDAIDVRVKAGTLELVQLPDMPSCCLDIYM